MDNREISEKIATEIMGWAERNSLWVANTGWYRSCDGPQIICRVDAWNPPENIAQAFEVVEKMREKGWVYFQLDTHRTVWTAGFQPRFASAESDTPAMAISLASLEALKEIENG